MTSRRPGFALLPVVLMIGLLAAIAFLLTHDGAMSTELLHSAADADEAGYVADAGLEHALWKLEASGCGGDLTLATTTLGAHSYSGSIAAGGATTAFTLDLDQDAWIGSDDSDENHGNTGDQRIGLEDDDVEQALFRFDLAALPAGARINAATARFLVKDAHPEGPITVHAVTADWIESGVSWNSFAGSFESAPLARIPPQPLDDVWVEINLAAQVQAWVNGAPNHGILLAASSEDTEATYVGKEAGSASERPQLDVVVGSGPASPASLQVTGSLDNGVQRGRDRAAVPVYQPGSAFVVQPDASQGKDSYLWQLHPTTEYGNADETRVAKTPGDAAVALFEFDLSGLPPGAKIQSARLSLHHRSGSGTDVPITAHRVTEAWSEASANWTKRSFGSSWDAPGGDFDPSVIASTPVGPASSRRYAWDLTPLVQGWLAGTWANEGVILRTGLDGTVGERFDTSDHADPSRHPRLEVTYSCECGVVCVAPAGAGNVMLIVRDPFSPDPSDSLKQAMIESWGYDVDLVGDGTTGFLWDFAIAGHDVVYVSATVDPAQLGTRLSGESIGVVSEAGFMNDELGLATGHSTPVDADIDVSDTNHFITRPFALGPIPLYDARMRLTTASGSLAPAARVLAEWGGAGALLALEQGEAAAGGGTAPGRRVMLPIGGGETIDWSRAGTHTWVLIHRALRWAQGESDTGDPGPPISASPKLWLSTEGDVKDSGAPGLDDWTEAEALVFDEPDLALEPGTTEGTFASVLDLDDFGNDVDIDAIHYVDTAVSVGSANRVDLLPGDVLLSTAADENLSSTNSLSVKKKDVFVFRPQVAGDYSAGTFLLLLEGSEIAGLDTTGISLVEKKTSVGDATLARGSLLMTTKTEKDVFLFTPFDVGLDTTSGSFGLLVDGSELNIDKEIRGVELAEHAVTLGGHAIPEGAILLVLKDDDSGGVGDNALPVEAVDVFYLSVTQLGANPAADAVLLFEGGDVALDDKKERLDAVALESSASASAAKVLFVVDTAEDLTDEETAHETLIESWGYAIERIDADAGQAEFDDAVARNDVVFITNDVAPSDVDTKLSNAAIGVVTSEVDLSDELALADGVSWESGSQVEINDNTHYITQPFSMGSLTLFSSSQSLAYVTGALAPHLAELASSSSGFGIVAIAAGADALGGGPSPGRRVQLPWGGSGFDPGNLTPDGQLLLRRALEWGAGEGEDGGGPGLARYVELHEPWSAEIKDVWETVSLDAYVPANAVVEVAVTNGASGNERWGGVRAVGSVLERRLKLNEAESGGVDAVVMHVQADAGSRIQTYSDEIADVSFTLLGYWTGAAYVERFEPFEAGGSGSWEDFPLATLGAGAGQVAEIAVANASGDEEREGGVQPTGADLGRRLALHEAEGGGVDAFTLMVTAGSDANASVQVYAESRSDVEFTLLGTWSHPPGSYASIGGMHVGVPQADEWETLAAGPFGTPAGAVLQLVMANLRDTAEVEQGVRAMAGSQPRTLDLQEAEDGGADTASVHVNVDSGSQLEGYSEYSGADQRFYPVGWWIPSGAP